MLQQLIIVGYSLMPVSEIKFTICSFVTKNVRIMHIWVNINNIQPEGSTRSIHLLGLLTSTWNSKKETKEKRVHQIYVVHPKYELRPREGLSLYYLHKSPVLQYEPSPHACHTIQYPQNIQERIDTKTYIISLTIISITMNDYLTSLI